MESGTKSLQQELFEGVPQVLALNELAHLKVILQAGKKTGKPANGIWSEQGQSGMPDIGRFPGIRVRVLREMSWL